MSRAEAIDQYIIALNMGKKYYKACMARGQYPYPQVLEQLLQKEYLLRLLPAYVLRHAEVSQTVVNVLHLAQGSPLKRRFVLYQEVHKDDYCFLQHHQYI